MVMFTNEDGSKNQLKTRIAMVVVAIIVFAGAYAYNAYRSTHNPAYIEQTID